MVATDFLPQQWHLSSLYPGIYYGNPEFFSVIRQSSQRNRFNPVKLFRLPLSKGVAGSGRT